MRRRNPVVLALVLACFVLLFAGCSEVPEESASEETTGTVSLTLHNVQTAGDSFKTDMSPGSAFTLSDPSQRTGLAFKGWSTTDANDGTGIVSSSQIVVEDDTDLYAVWSATVTF